MSRARQQQKFGWETSSKYHENLIKMARTPTLQEAPQYSNLHMIFKNKETSEKDEQRTSPVYPKAAKKVQVTDRQEVIEEDSNGNLAEAVEEDVNYEADNFIDKKQKGFKLSKWKTFKLS